MTIKAIDSNLGQNIDRMNENQTNVAFKTITDRCYIKDPIYQQVDRKLLFSFKFNLRSF